MSYMDHLSEKRKIESQIEFSMGSGKIPLVPLFCTPNCQHAHHHNYQYDFSKNFSDPRAERPGVAFLEGLKSQKLKTYDCPELVGELTLTQSPIDLSTAIAIKRDFRDDVFAFNYEKISVNTNKTIKFNEAADCYYF